ncbi:interleukin-17 receptor A [Rana temporaria]|uniref:interleukin-17 receptor A n=1 Tax=Rana temporaria TaxID=8407 RepID=UPI001AAD18CC|nr:interleukin-17 receptor A [Rana temporaria]
MGGTEPIYRALIGLSVLITGVWGLRVIRQGDNCSQTGIQCTIKTNNSCLDFDWFRDYTWTPAAPSHMVVTAGIGQNEMGRRVVRLHINWTVSVDASILELQGVDITVLKRSTQMTRCVQFQFNNQFGTPRNPDGQPWQFFYNNFEVIPGNTYIVTVQHLPRQEGNNAKVQEFTVPWCNEGDMMQTDTCCDLGYCWSPNITIKHQEENLTVEFNSRWNAKEYGVHVKVRGSLDTGSGHVIIKEGPPIQRLQITFPHIGGHIDKECVYNISVWPYMSPCNNDCVRQTYVPPCATETPPPPEPIERWYLWSVAVLLTILLFAGIFLGLCAKDCFTSPEKVKPDPWYRPIPDPTIKKVWLVYSADHGHYIKVVIGLADFMRSAWGLDVVLDRLHVLEMSTIGPMAWLDRQKDAIEKTNGTILILCSRGVQEKWKAMQNVKEQKMTLREDRDHPIEDLFTPALSLILPDFQKAMPYDRYVVAYFSSISTPADIPSPLELCPKYSLTENLQGLFFRIQRQEQHQPYVQLTVNHEEHRSYQRLVKAIEGCRKWQECNLHWFEKECLLMPTEDTEDTEEEEDMDDNVTRKLSPLIRRPETSVSMLEPRILIPDLVKVLDPTIVIGASSTQVEPCLSDIDPLVSVVQPFIQEVASAVICIQEPRLIGEAPSLGELNKGLLRQDVSIQSDQGVLSIEQLREAQERFFQNSLEDPNLSSAMEFMDAQGQDLVNPIYDMARDQAVKAGEQFHEILLDGQLITPAVDPGTGLPDRRSIQLADQGYSTWNPYEMDLKAIQMESLKLFLQNEGGLQNFEV